MYRLLGSMPLKPFASCLLPKAALVENIERGFSNGSLPVYTVEVLPHTRGYFVMVDVVAAVDLLSEKRQKLVVTALANPDLCPGIAIGMLALPVLHDDDVCLPAHVSPCSLGALSWIEPRPDQLLKQRGGSPSLIGCTDAALDTLDWLLVGLSYGVQQTWILPLYVSMPIAL